MDLSGAGLQKSFRSFWDKLSAAQKVITIIAPLLVAGALFSLIFWASKPEYVSIFTKLNEADAGAVTEKLKDLGVDYKLGNNGSTILVPQKDAAETRLQLASAGLPQKSKFSFEYLTDGISGIGQTESDRKLRYILGLQNELEITIKTLAGISDARVHIVIPEESIFAEKEKLPTAAVTITRIPGAEINKTQIRGIANLISFSVEGLQPENVTIIDTIEGINLWPVAKDDISGDWSQIQYQKQVEDMYVERIQSMLNEAFSYGMTIVRVNASINFDKITREDLLHGPGAKVSEQKTQETNKSGMEGAVPGPESNVPGYPSTTGSASTSENVSSTINWEVDKMLTQTIVSPGALRRLSVSVMVNSHGLPLGDKGETQVQDIVENIRMSVGIAAGIDESRGDQINVVAMPFYKPTYNQGGAGSDSQSPMAPNDLLMKYAPIAGGALFILLLFAMVLRSRSKRRRTKDEAKEIELQQPMTVAKAEEFLLSQQKAEEEANLRFAQKQARTAEEIERQKVKDAVEKYSKNNPDEVARLIKTWLAEER